MSQRRSALSENKSTVKGLLRNSDKAQHEASGATPFGRGKPGNAGKIGLDQDGRSKATFDISLARQTMLKEICEAESASPSGLVEAAIVALYNAWQAGRFSVEDYREPARSLRVDWNVIVPDEFQLF